MNRHERIRYQLNRLQELGIVDDWYGHSLGYGKKWVFVPRGYTQRSLTTSQVEDFILGTQAALNSPKVEVVR